MLNISEVHENANNMRVKLLTVGKFIKLARILYACSKKEIHKNNTRFIRKMAMPMYLSDLVLARGLFHNYLLHHLYLIILMYLVHTLFLQVYNKIIIFMDFLTNSYRCCWYFV